MTRHLLYYVLPVAGPVWRANVAELLRRVDLFNGRRVCAVARQRGAVRYRGGPLRVECPSAVWELLAPHGFRMIDVENSPTLGEAAAFRSLWGSVSDLAGPDDFTFYAHAKGVSWPTGDPAVSVHDWTALLYAANLDYPSLVEEKFADPQVGVLGSLQQPRPDGRPWHYSGAFFWFRNSRTFSKKWWHRGCPPRWSGVELWPARVFAPAETGCLFTHRPDDWNAYDRDSLDRILADFAVWSDSNVRHRRPGASPRPHLEYRERLK